MNNLDETIQAITSAVDRTDYLYEKWAKHLGVNSYVSRIMYMIYASGITKQKEIVENYGMPKQTVNTVITELQKKGHIRLIPDENDKRSKIIQLTAKGTAYADSIIAPLVNCEKTVLAEMGEERVKMLIDTLNQYAELFEKVIMEYFRRNSE